MCVCLPRVLAQQDVPQVSYEGQKVAFVDLVARPTIAVESFRPLVVLKAGEPYSSDRVQASISALEQTGRFSRVEVDVKPEAAGLRVIFIMQPAYYIGDIKFPGAAKRFSYPRLLQVVNLPNEEPYQAGRVAEAETALVRFFQANGYFLARVETETQLDESHKLVKLIFHVDLNKLARFGRVEVIGPRPPEDARLAHALHSLRAILKGAYLRSGRKYSRERLDAAVRFLKDYLGDRDRPANQVRFTSRYRADKNRADLIFNVEEGPAVSVKIAGARLSRLPFTEKRTLHRLIPIWEEDSFDRDLVQEGQRNLVNYFQAKGYFDVRVQPVITEEPDKVSVVYQIDKGKRHEVTSVAFAGNSHFSEQELRSHISIEKARFLRRGRYSEQLVKKSVDNLTAFYQNAGFEEVKVEPKVIDREPQIDVTFQITEGPQTLVQDFRIVGNHAIPLAELDPPGSLNLTPGQPFSQGRMNQDRDAIMAKYLDNGFLTARFKVTVRRNPADPHQVDVAYEITEGPQVHVSEVVFLGQRRTQQRLINRTADLRSERPLSQSKLLESESRLYDLGIFDWASVAPRRPITDQDQEEVLVKVHEAKRNSLTFGFGFEVAHRAGSLPSGTVALPGLPPIAITGFKSVSSEKTFLSPRGSIEYSRRNMRGLGETGAISARLARLDQRGLLTYTDPHFRGTNWSSLFSLSVERTLENPIFTARLGEASFQVQRFLDARRTKTVQFRYGFRRTLLSQLLIPDLVPVQDRSVRLSTLSASFIRDTRDKPLDAHKGIYQTFDFGVTPKALGSSANFARFLGQTAYYRPIRSIVWANNVRLGLAKPFSGSDVPLSERFFSGGATTLRGFPINGAGPQRLVPVCSNPADQTTCSKVRVPVGGNQLFIVNSEMRFPIPVKKGLGGVVFYDGGNVYDRIGFSRFGSNFSNTVGIGLRYATPVGPVRFDVGHNLNPVSGFKSTQFFFTLGQAF